MLIHHTPLIQQLIETYSVVKNFYQLLKNKNIGLKLKSSQVFTISIERILGHAVHVNGVNIRSWNVIRIVNSDMYFSVFQTKATEEISSIYFVKISVFRFKVVCFMTLPASQAVLLWR
jgi:hypothetical protein